APFEGAREAEPSLKGHGTGHAGILVFFEQLDALAGAVGPDGFALPREAVLAVLRLADARNAEVADGLGHGQKSSGEPIVTTGSPLSQGPIATTSRTMRLRVPQLGRCTRNGTDAAPRCRRAASAANQSTSCKRPLESAMPAGSAGSTRSSTRLPR